MEIWQCDAKGVYLHTADSGRKTRDANFQGFGRFLTGSSGEYYFRTIKPVPYPGRTPHIHFKVKVRGQWNFTTQCYVRGEQRNARDGIYNSIRDARAREAVTVAFNPTYLIDGNDAGWQFPDRVISWGTDSIDVAVTDFKYESSIPAQPTGFILEYHNASYMSKLGNGDQAGGRLTDGASDGKTYRFHIATDPQGYDTMAGARRGSGLRAAQARGTQRSEGVEDRALLRLPDPAAVACARLRGSRPPLVARADHRGVRR